MASLDAASSREIRNVLKQLPNSIIEIAHHYDLEDYDAVYRIENKSIVRIKQQELHSVKQDRVVAQSFLLLYNLNILISKKTPKSSDSGVLMLFFFFLMVQNGIEDDGKQACNDDTV